MCNILFLQELIQPVELATLFFSLSSPDVFDKAIVFFVGKVIVFQQSLQITASFIERAPMGWGGRGCFRTQEITFP
jgi:hypothetical protein